MKRKGHLFKSVRAFDNLYDAFKKAFRASGRSAAACRFHFRVDTELIRLKSDLSTGAYRPAPYHHFQIFDPKERIISVAEFRDRVVHHALVGVLARVFEPRFIHDSYATREGKGPHRAVERAQGFMRHHPFYLKADVCKYFDTIRHDILVDLIRRKIKDPQVMNLIAVILRNGDAGRGIGLPIGNLTSQFFANVYLDPLDHYLKDDLGLKAYIRYMDDMVMFADSRDELKEVHHRLVTFLGEQLGLRIHMKVTQINTRVHGLPFLGYRVFPKLLRIKRDHLKRVKRKMRMRIRELEEGRISEKTFIMSVGSMFAHLRYADTRHVRREIMRAL